jgi:hypothetical protein
MNLDLPTLMVMQSFALACAGAVLLFAWLQNRVVSALAFWGLANILAAAGILALMLGVMFRQPAWSAIGGVLLPFQASLMWKAARTIDAKPAPFILFLGPLIVGVAGGLPGLRDATAALSLTIGAAYTFAAAMTLWLGRRERLAARSPLIILSALHGTALLIGTYSTSPARPAMIPCRRSQACLALSILKASSLHSALRCSFLLWSRSAMRPSAKPLHARILSLESPTESPSWKALRGFWNVAGVTQRRFR